MRRNATSKLVKTLVPALLALVLIGAATAQETAQTGFVISLKNGSTIRGRTLMRDESTGTLRLAMSETASGEAKSYAVISPDDTAEIRSSAAGDADSIRIRLKGGSELKCKEFALSGDSVSVKLGTASRVDVKWSDIESISFTQ